MKNHLKVFTILFFVTSSFFNVNAQTTDQAADAAVDKKALEYVSGLNLNDAAKTIRVTKVVSTHMKAVRDWHNNHPFTTVPEGINPVTGNKLTELDRQIIADSAIPSTVHQNLMEGLSKDLTPTQVELILDRYTVGKVDFTLKGYRAIVPNITPVEEAKLLNFLKEAREQAVDYKSMKQISAIFEIYKTKSEQYLNANGRNWRDMYNAFTKKLKEEKAKKQ
jgi:hypothetical protein